MAVKPTSNVMLSACGSSLPSTRMLNDAEGLFGLNVREGGLMAV